MVLLRDLAMRDAAADGAGFAVGGNGFSCGHALQDGKILPCLWMVGLDNQHPVVEVPRVIELVLRGADVPDSQKRFDVIRSECQGLVV